jgi:hypothetical protein
MLPRFLNRLRSRPIVQGSCKQESSISSTASVGLGGTTILMPSNQTSQKTRFLLGGWSWKRNRFLTSAIRYNSKKNEFAAYRPTRTIKRLNLADGKFCVAIGNYTPEFFERLVDAIAEKNLRSLNYEPLDILVEMLRTDKFTNRRSEEALYSRSDKAER